MGFQLENPDLLQEQSSKIIKLLGRSHILAYIDREGRIAALGGLSRTSHDIFIDATVDSHGRVLALRSDLTLRLYQTLEDIFTGNGSSITIEHTLTVQSRLYSGAAHFIIHVSDDILYSLGSDNRFFQLGHASRAPSLTRAEQLTLFEGSGSIAKVACGDLHTAVLTDEGALYLFGSDVQGQCGGCTGHEPILVELEPEEDNEEQPDVLDVACGSRHTVILTASAVYATGSSGSRLGISQNSPDPDRHLSADHVGQLGFGDIEPRSTFTKVDLSAGMPHPSNVHASGWNTLFSSTSDTSGS